MNPTLQLIQYLNRGGQYGYYWCKSPAGPSHTEWFNASQPTDIPTQPLHTYFGVNPSKIRKSHTQRAEINDIAAVNALFADFDAKDFNGSKESALDHINHLHCPPTVLVDSGGGYQGYWLLRNPQMIETAEQLAQLRDLQARWVAYVGSDPGAKDLARVLRVPGTKNYKYEPARAVSILWADYTMPYDLDDFFALLPTASQPATPAAVPAPVGRNSHDSQDPGAYWLGRALGQAREGNRNDTGFWLACQLRDAGLSEQAAHGVMMQYASSVGAGQHGKYTESEAAATLKSAYHQPAREAAHSASAGAGVIEWHPAEQPARENGHHNGNGKHHPKNEGLGLPVENLPYDFLIECLELQESGDANLLARLFAGKLAYDHSESSWYIWAGHYWKPDVTGLAVWLVARAVAPQYLAAAAAATAREKDKLAEQLVKRAAALRNRKRIDNVLFLAARLETLSLAGDEWDSNPWLLACENGVIELNTGNFRAGQPADFIRAHSPVQWAGIDTTATRWEKFISEIFDNNQDLAGYINRLLGYGVTGLTTEHVLPILWGDEGRNGKSTMLEVLGYVLGHDLATSSQADALMDTQQVGGGPQPFVYALRGKRLVWASESNEGRRINAGLVKQLTGGDRLHVRTLHTKPVEFYPSHLLLLLTNNKPHINAADSAIWERVALIPFTMRFLDNPREENERARDKNLIETLRAESAGILAWLVRGCLWWQQAGLNPPAMVQAATSDYRNEEDTTGIFIGEKCIIGAGCSIRAGQLYKAYQDWCHDNGIPAMSNTAFGRLMKRRFKSKESHGIVYLGVGLAAV